MHALRQSNPVRNVTGFAFRVSGYTGTPRIANPKLETRNSKPFPTLFVLLLLLASATAGLCADDSEAQNPNPETRNSELEYQVKAGFIYNFAKFVEWPTNAPAAETFRITVVDDGAIYRVLSNELSGKVLGGKPVVVEAARLNKLPRDTHILFLPGNQPGDPADVWKQLGDVPVLTIGEKEGFAERGGSINFIRKGENIRFEINLGAAECAHLKLSSKLAAMATLVKTKEAAK